MCPNDRAIDEVHRPVELTFPVSFSLQGCPDLLPKAFGRPAPEPAGDRGPFAEALWDVAPRRTCSEHPKDATDDGTVLQIWTSQTKAGWQEGLQTLPVFIRDFFAPQHEKIPLLLQCSSLCLQTLEQQRQQVALEVGAESTARIFADLGSPVSADTLLRRLHQGVSAPADQVRHLGIDDWAWRKGKRYGTILVDLERHQVIDLLPDRETDTLIAWLKLHPEVTLITRDRAGAYQEGATRGAPQAQQVADRWHLLKNLREALERSLQRVYDSLKPLGKSLAQNDPEPSTPLELPPEPVEVTGSQHPPTARQQARFEQVKALLSQGGSVRQVAREAGVATGTVRKYRALEHPPGSAARFPRATVLTPYLEWLNAQLSSGNHTAVKLYDQLRAQGYRGGYTTLRAYCFQFQQDNR